MPPCSAWLSRFGSYRLWAGQDSNRKRVYGAKSVFSASLRISDYFRYHSQETHNLAVIIHSWVLEVPFWPWIAFFQLAFSSSLWIVLFIFSLLSRYFFSHFFHLISSITHPSYYCNATSWLRSNLMVKLHNHALY